MADADNTESAMTKTDAKECRSLVKSEYKFLNDEISGQANRVKSDAREAIDLETEKMLKNARSRVETLRGHAETVSENARKAMQVIRKEAEAVEAKSRKLQEELRDQGIEFNLGFSKPQPVTFSGHKSDNPVTFEVGTDLKHTNQQARLQKALGIVDEQVNNARRSIKIEENSAVRDLTMNMMSSQQAKNFIANIPTLENLIDAPNLKQIEA